MSQATRKVAAGTPKTNKQTFSSALSLKAALLRARPLRADPPAFLPPTQQLPWKHRLLMLRGVLARCKGNSSRACATDRSLRMAACPHRPLLPLHSTRRTRRAPRQAALLPPPLPVSAGAARRMNRAAGAGTLPWREPSSRTRRRDLWQWCPEVWAVALAVSPSLMPYRLLPRSMMFPCARTRARARALSAHVDLSRESVSRTVGGCVLRWRCLRARAADVLAIKTDVGVV